MKEIKKTLFAAGVANSNNYVRPIARNSKTSHRGLWAKADKKA